MYYLCGAYKIKLRSQIGLLLKRIIIPIKCYGNTEAKLNLGEPTAFLQCHHKISMIKTSLLVYNPLALTSCTEDFIIFTSEMKKRHISLEGIEKKKLRETEHEGKRIKTGCWEKEVRKSE